MNRIVCIASQLDYQLIIERRFQRAVHVDSPRAEDTPPPHETAADRQFAFIISLVYASEIQA